MHPHGLLLTTRKPKTPFLHNTSLQAPPNDGGVCVGQLVVEGCLCIASGSKTFALHQLLGSLAGTQPMMVVMMSAHFRPMQQ